MEPKTMVVGGALVAGLLWAGDKVIPRPLLPSPAFPLGSTNFDMPSAPTTIDQIPQTLPLADKNVLLHLLTAGQLQDFRAYLFLYEKLAVLPTTISTGELHGDHVQLIFQSGIAEFRYYANGAIELVQLWQ